MWTKDAQAYLTGKLLTIVALFATAEIVAKADISMVLLTNKHGQERVEALGMNFQVVTGSAAAQN